MPRHVFKVCFSCCSRLSVAIKSERTACVILLLLYDKGLTRDMRLYIISDSLTNQFVLAAGWFLDNPQLWFVLKNQVPSLTLKVPCDSETGFTATSPDRI